MKRESFEGLECWKQARDLRKKISIITDEFHESEKYLLKSQIIRSSRSVTANIAEGWGRYNFKENMRFCRIARGSLFETLDHLITALDENYITENQLTTIKNDVYDCVRVLNGYINFLKKQGESIVNEPESTYFSGNNN